MTLSCAQESRSVEEPLAGTAPTALTWLAVEESGPWGADALRDAHLPEILRASLLRLKADGVGVLLIRRPGRREGSDPRTVLLARTAPGGSLLRTGHLAHDGQFEGWDGVALAAGRLPAFGQVSNHPQLLVCTQGRRDACCALEGRALLSSLMLDSRASYLVWESSHLGGHRFAPVTLSLPSGMVHGRLPAESGPHLLDALVSDTVITEHLRGRSCLPAPLQAAGVAVRRATQETLADSIDVLAVIDGRAVPVQPRWIPAADEVDCEVRHRDGRAWHVVARRVKLAEARRESCQGQAQEAWAWQADEPAPLPCWA